MKVVTAEGEELPVPFGPSSIPTLRKQQSLPRLFTSTRGRKVNKSTPSWPAGQESQLSSQPPTPKLPPWVMASSPSGGGAESEGGGRQKQDGITEEKSGGTVGGQGGSGTSRLPQRLKMNQLTLPKRGQSVTTAQERHFQRSGTLQDPTSPGLRAIPATVPRQAPMLHPTQRSPTFPLMKDDSYDSLNMPYGLPSVPIVRGPLNASKKPLPLPPRSTPPRPYTAASIGHNSQKTPIHFDYGIGQEDGDQQERSGNQPLPPIPNEQEVRASLNSAENTNSSYLDSTITERSSVLTRCSSASDLTIDYTSSPVSKSEGMTVDDAISMYAAGFMDDISDSEDEAETTPLPVNDERRRSRRIAEATSDHMEPNLLSPKPPFASEQRSSAAIMSGDGLRSSSPRPPSIRPPTSARDCYGFYKANTHITVDQYDAWNVTYGDVQNRRHKRWIAFMKEHCLSTDNPVCFPERSAKTQRFIRKGIPPAWRGSAWFYYAGGNTLLDKNPNLYSSLLTRANAGELSENDRELIERDLYRTFPDNIHFKPDPTANPSSPSPDPYDPSCPFHIEPPLVSSLRHLLRAFAIHNPQIGYCQSLNFLAGLLLLFLPEEKAFWMLDSITTDFLPGTHSLNLEGANVDLWVLMNALKQSNMPAVWAKVSGGGADSQPHTPSDDHADGALNGRPPRLPAISLCTTAWFMSLFIGTLPVESTLRVWDVLFYEGPRTIFRVALAIFKLGERDIGQVSDAVEVFQAVQRVPRGLLDAGRVISSRLLFNVDDRLEQPAKWNDRGQRS
ncbi:Rab-GTPase-TBC domain [Lasallia pustulata]|uniref:Rab-GTPase-TBC domain n=1 Tax=Lasallia pustulata TaxID=136370 RepID=A0A1W5D9C6_9LECA|nr:Rab-GTPase-TBC domain [Lasallia pustulata]